VQAQAEPPPSVSILLAKDSEHFQFAYDVLADDATAREFSVLRLLLLGQLSTAWLLRRSMAVAMQFLESLRAFIGSTRDLCRDSYLAPLEQVEIVLASLADSDTDDRARLVRDNALGFLGVAPLFPAVVAPLFFGGRSIGLSATSTMITSTGGAGSRAKAWQGVLTSFFAAHAPGGHAAFSRKSEDEPRTHVCTPPASIPLLARRS
jgi:hypothetical protein